MAATRIGAIILLCAAAGAAPTVASADPSGAALQQYVEVVPGAAGATTPPGSSSTESAAHQYVEVVPSATGGPGAGSLAAPTQASPASPVGAAVNAVATGDERDLIGLAVAMIVVTVCLLGAAAARYRRRAWGARG